MGVTLERAKIAEHLNGQCHGRQTGGLGVSVIIVGALLAASTGIVGATVARGTALPRCSVQAISQP